MALLRKRLLVHEQREGGSEGSVRSPPSSLPPKPPHVGLDHVEQNHTTVALQLARLEQAGLSVVPREAAALG